MRQEALFPKAEIPRAPFVKRMHVADAGNSCIEEAPLWFLFKCNHCGYKEEGCYEKMSITEAKRGLPCPKCNDV